MIEIRETMAIAGTTKHMDLLEGKPGVFVDLFECRARLIFVDLYEHLREPPFSLVRL